MEMIGFAFLLLGLLSPISVGSRIQASSELLDFEALNCRKHSSVLTQFGGKGDGKTSNTNAFRSAISQLSNVASDGGAQLIVPPGRWLTGSFNLTSHFTLYIHKDAVILASQDESEWLLIKPLPSYGRGRDDSGHGGNGTIDGQGAIWWQKFKNKQLQNTRPYLIEIMFSTQVQISNLTLLNSPSWNVHPVYCSDVIIQGLTIRAPVDSPNTDGINPDSCSNVRIQDCDVVSGDDCIAVKSGWDEYGIAFGMPTQQLIIRRFTCVSPYSAAIALGSEMSGGIRDVRAEDITAVTTESAVRIKTAVGRGAYVKDIYVKGVTMHTMKYVFWMTGNYGEHPDNGYDPKALPVIQNINYRRHDGRERHDCSKKGPWNCTGVSGVSSKVSPQPCSLLPEKQPGTIVPCAYPEDKLPIDNVQLKTCSASV
ncbi:pectin lyase-like superfamily protein [Actinidia rufa]|uniref:Pectin lyase-like superfamily protein n=1 Tax=Actinidia rufa TaxID=165716 RepID=A0A7J0G6Q1_9ERIC|nr:pectin lyase-like superfamily protein [Actinidia rufa]